MKKALNIAFLGTRGIPNTYGGFEQCAEFLGKGLVEKGHQVTVYNSSNHSYQLPIWNGVNLIHCNDPEDKLGTIGQFIYDLNCIRHARHQDYDVIIQFGYTSSSIWNWLWPKQSGHIVNMDGLEFRRDKYGPITKRYLKLAERWATVRTSLLVADNIGIQNYLKQRFPSKEIRFISYGADIPSPSENNESILSELMLSPNSFDLIICRMEPENSVETMLQAQKASSIDRMLVVVGDTSNAYGHKLLDQYSGANIIFTQGIYDIHALHALRNNCRFYLHGHTVGGTNPSLLEALANAHNIVAHDNEFNRSVLGEHASYFSQTKDLTKLLSKSEVVSNLALTREVIRQNHDWNHIINKYEAICYEVV
jgi:hypothetical protein